MAQLEEVVVTAQRRAESLQDVPIAINALTGDTLDRLDVRDTDDIVNLYPGLSIQTSHAANSGFTIRGVGTANFHITGQQAVGQYMDGVSMYSPWTSTVGLFDMERVEVLRGPQNTLFGRNTTGGAVNFISRKPDVGGETNGHARVRAGNEGRMDFEGAIGFPIGDNAAARVAVTTENRDAIFNNLVPGFDDVGDIERNGVRAQLTWEPSDRTSLLFNLHANYNRGRANVAKGLGIWDGNGTFPVNADTTGDGMADSVLPFGDPAILANLGPVHDCPVRNNGTDSFDGLNNCVALTPFAGPTVNNPSTADWNDVYAWGPQTADFDYEGVFFNLTHDFDSFSLEAITSYDEITGDFNGASATPGAASTGLGFYPGQAGTFEVFSQELRLSSTTDGAFRWIVGSYFSSEDDRLATIINRTDPTAPPFGVVPSVTIEQDVSIWSVYGQGEFDFSDSTTLTIGVRYTDDQKDGTSITRLAAFNPTGALGGARFPINQYISLAQYDAITAPAVNTCPGPPTTWPCRSEIPVVQELTEVGYKVGLDHFFNDNIMGYVSFSRGFKSGAFDTRALAAFAGTADRPVLPEFLDAFEIGHKSTHGDGRVELSSAVYFYTWEDRQTFDVDDLGRPAFVNIPEAEVTGLELEAKWAPDETWFIQAGINVQDTEITKPGGLLSIRQGARLSNASDLSYTGLVSKTFDLTDGNALTLQTNFKYDGDVNSGLDGDLEQLIGSNMVINARGSYYFGPDQRYEVSVWADNITEEKLCLGKGTLDALNYQYTCLPNAGMAFVGMTFSAQF